MLSKFYLVTIIPNFVILIKSLAVDTYIKRQMKVQNNTIVQHLYQDPSILAFIFASVWFVLPEIELISYTIK